MGVDTKGLLRGKVPHEEVLNFIRQKYDSNAKSFVEKREFNITEDQKWIKEVYGDPSKRVEWSGFIQFKDGTDTRSIFYVYTNINSWENIDYYSSCDLEDMVKSETTYLSLGYGGNSVDIIKSIVSHFEGWIDENDCDDEPFYPIEKNTDGSIKPVIRVTMDEIYEKFGGVVLIQKDK